MVRYHLYLMILNVTTKNPKSSNRLVDLKNAIVSLIYYRKGEKREKKGD